MNETIDNVKQPFAEQLAFFMAKLGNLVPTASWKDLQKSQHDRAFMVAGAAKADLLTDLYNSVNQSITDGKSIEWFRQNFDGIVEKHGWDYTGERNWRTRVIYTTNLQTSYAAGRFAQLSDPKLLQLKPLWQYKHNDSVLHPRPEHVSWHNTALPSTHLFWKTHFTPNGWGCKCYIIAVSYEEAVKSGAQLEAPANYEIGEGIDEGWNYAPGSSVLNDVRQSVKTKIKSYPKPIAEALKSELKTKGLKLDNE